MTLTPRALSALRLLEHHTARSNTLSAKALARLLWPEKLHECKTSLRRGGYYRAAGAFFSALEKKGYVAHWMDDFSSGYYLTQKGLEAIATFPGTLSSSQPQEK